MIIQIFGIYKRKAPDPQGSGVICELHLLAEFWEEMDSPQLMLEPEDDEPETVESAIVQLDNFCVPTRIARDTGRDDSAEIVLRE